MTNWIPSSEMRSKILPKSILREWQRRRILRSPAAFRHQLRLNPDDEQSLADRLLSWQQDDFAALDAGWVDVADRGSRVRRVVERVVGSDEVKTYRRAYIERARGHSKTTDMAIQIAWVMLAARRAVNGLVAAADRDQANLIHRAVRRLAEANEPYCDDLQFVQHLIRNRRTGSRMEVISSDIRGSWGALPDFVICDELCHWRSPELWYSLMSSAAKNPLCMLVVLTNAGIGRGWQWDVRTHAESSGAWHFSSLKGPQAPWITEDWLEEQKALLPPAIFARYWLNEWQHSDGEFVSLAEAEACRDESLVCQESGDASRSYIAAIDYAEKRDFTVGCVCHYDGSRIVVDRMDVVKPSPTTPTPVQWVDDWIESVAARFPDVQFVIDEHQLVGTIQRLEQRHRIERFDFGAGKGNHRLAVHLRQLITQKQVAWYPDCGAVDSGHHSPSDDRLVTRSMTTTVRDDLETELASLLLKQSSNGRLRIDHHCDNVHHDDRAFTLGAACLHLSEHMPAGDEIFVVTPPTVGGFVW